MSGHGVRYGWRCWDIGRDGSLYSPVNFGPEVLWLPAGIAAKCEAGHSHRVPDVDCCCGLRAVDSFAALVPQLQIAIDVRRPTVVGVVALAGTVLGRDRHGDPPGTLRAARAQVAGPLFLGAAVGSAAQAVADWYSTDVVVSDCSPHEWIRGGLERDVETFCEQPDVLRLAGRAYRPRDKPPRREAVIRRVRRIEAAAPTPPGDWDEVIPRLWMGGSAVDPTPGVFDAVLTVCADASTPPGRVEHLQWPIEDRISPPPPEERLQEVTEWVLDRLAAGQRVLVRCQSGWNRSGLVVGRVLTELGHSPREAVDLIRRVRGSRALRNRTFAALVLDVDLPTVARWGIGGAGILFCRNDGPGLRYLLLQRSWRTSEPLSWGLPGGGLLPNEDPWHGAVREAGEEIGLPADQVKPFARHDMVEPDGWTYTTFLVDGVPAVRLNPEHIAYRWASASEARLMRLHPDLDQAWAKLTRRASQAKLPAAAVHLSDDAATERPASVDPQVRAAMLQALSAVRGLRLQLG